ncbi:hypothetical protein N9A72_00060 [bacterium]|nr:hypothetical protein [bacterium]
MKKGLILIMLLSLFMSLSIFNVACRRYVEEDILLEEEEEEEEALVPAEKRVRTRPAKRPAKVARAPETTVSPKGIKTTTLTGLFKPFNVYTDRMARGNHYIPSGWMGDYGAIKMNEAYKTNPHSGKTCIKFTYTGKSPQGAGWTGVYWQNPANNWGKIKGGYDLTGARELSFWARGATGGEIVEFKMGGITGEYSDSDSATTGPITLTRHWKNYKISLKGMDLHYISGGFVWVTSMMNAPQGMVFCLDDIIYR